MPDQPGNERERHTRNQTGSTESPRRPNVLLLFVDQQRWDTLGVNGCPMDLTPNLDAVAWRGVRFEIPITVQPVCAPARATLLTGQYATTHGVWRNGLGLGGNEVTLATPRWCQ